MFGVVTHNTNIFTTAVEYSELTDDVWYKLLWEKQKQNSKYM